MSRPLNRPMFRMGGTPNSNSGIVSGFEKPRENFAAGTQGVFGTAEEEEVLANLQQQELDNSNVISQIMNVKQDTADRVSGLRQDLMDSYTSGAPAQKKGFGFNDYMSLVKLGAGIAGAPNRGSGLKGFAASASPAISDFATDMQRNQAIKRARIDEYAKEMRDAKRGLTAMDIEAIQKEGQIDLSNIYKNQQISLEDQAKLGQIAVTQENAVELINKENINKLAQIRETAKLDKTEFEKMTDAYQKHADTILTSDDDAEIIAAYNSIGIAMSKVTSPIISKMTLQTENRIKKEAANKIMNDSTAPQEGEEGYEALLNTYVTAGKNKEALESLGIYLDTLQDRLAIARDNNADGGRIGYANGTQPTMDPVASMTAQQPTTKLSYQELRSRLPQEVSDKVVRLLANSEEALFVFANIETQQDIANFNQRFNADLRMPAQTAV